MNYQLAIPKNATAKNSPYKTKCSFSKCQICGYKLFVESHHVQPKNYRNINGKLTINLCPNHHAVLDFLAFQLISTVNDDKYTFDEFKIEQIIKSDRKAFLFFEKWVEPVICETIGDNCDVITQLGIFSEQRKLRELINDN